MTSLLGVGTGVTEHAADHRQQRSEVRQADNFPPERAEKLLMAWCEVTLYSALVKIQVCS